jgi:copper chaperone CopZ
MRLLLILLIPAFILTGCSSKTNSKETSTEVSLAKENLTQVNLDVKGMTCEGCENTVVAGIKKLEGIQEATASHTAEEAVIVYDSTLITVEAISSAIADVGYSVEGKKQNPQH